MFSVLTARSLRVDLEPRAKRPVFRRGLQSGKLRGRASASLFCSYLESRILEVANLNWRTLYEDALCDTESDPDSPNFGKRRVVAGLHVLLLW
jgi:hypothetical protein